MTAPAPADILYHHHEQESGIIDIESCVPAIFTPKLALLLLELSCTCLPRKLMTKDTRSSPCSPRILHDLQQILPNDLSTFFRHDVLLPEWLMLLPLD